MIRLKISKKKFATIVFKINSIKNQKHPIIFLEIKKE
jgi:hypothetical protein